MVEFCAQNQQVVVANAALLDATRGATLTTVYFLPDSLASERARRRGAAPPLFTSRTASDNRWNLCSGVMTALKAARIVRFSLIWALFPPQICWRNQQGIPGAEWALPVVAFLGPVY